MISFDEANALVRELARPLATETVPLAAAHRRVLARDIVARIDAPRDDVSAMDGYAIRDEDLPRGAWTLVGRAYPGAPHPGVVGEGECVRIFTGAMVPPGASRVVVQEMVAADGETIRQTGEISRGRHIRPRGSDFTQGTVLLETGRLLDPTAMIAAAGADLATVEVYRRPRVAILGTGDELVAPGEAVATAHAIPQSVSFGVGALVADWGAEVGTVVAVRDDPDLIAAAARAAVAESDVLVLTGGASVGEKDFAKPALASLGLEIVFSKVKIRPGKPVWIGRIGATLVVGLPGNPTSAMVTARLFLAPLIAGLTGRDPDQAARWATLPLEAAMPAVGERETFVRGRFTPGGVMPESDENSGAQRVLALNDALIRVRSSDGARAAGDRVEVLAL